MAQFGEIKHVLLDIGKLSADSAHVKKSDMLERGNDLLDLFCQGHFGSTPTLLLSAFMTHPLHTCLFGVSRPLSPTDYRAKFPYALSALPTVLKTEWSSPTLAPYIDAFPPEHRTSPAALQAHVEDLTRRDVKIGYLKSLQGYLWETGYRTGAYSTPLFPDVVPALQSWKGEGKDLAIYSSGSIFAQKLLMEHVQLGGEGKVDDLRRLITGWFDTGNAGSKLEKGSYERIAGEQGWKASEVLFLSDNVNEVKAAREAGMDVGLLERAGNAPLGEEDKATYPVLTTLEDVKI